MRTTVLVLSLGLLGGCATVPRGPSSFSDAQRRFDAQPQTEATDAYGTVWDGFNNAHRLDEQDGCYAKAPGPLVQILQIDVNGKVVDYFADRQNGRSQCWRRTYLDVTFPKPPFAPFLIRMQMQ